MSINLKRKSCLLSKDFQHGSIQDGRKGHWKKSSSAWVIMALIYQSQGFRIYCNPFQMLWLRAYLCGPWLTCSMAGVMVRKTLIMVLCWWGFIASVVIQQCLSLYLDFKWELSTYHSLFIFHYLAGKIRKWCALQKRKQGNFVPCIYRLWDGWLLSKEIKTDTNVS